MKDKYTILLEIEALRIEVEGMIAENMQREVCENSMAYCEEDFLRMADKIRVLAKNLSEKEI